MAADPDPTGESETLAPEPTTLRPGAVLTLFAAAIVAAGAGWLLGGPTWDSAFGRQMACPGDATCERLRAVERGEAFGEAFHLLDRHGDRMATVAGPARRDVPLEDMPPLLIDGYVALEDRRFWEHDGVDSRAIVRAAIGNLWSGTVESGASTIAMQFARTLWADELGQTNRWARKLHEVMVAPRIVRTLGKRELLEAYLNSVYLGDGVSGVAAASEHYFGVPIDELDLAQTAMLIGITRTPERYDPRNEPALALARRNVVLDVLAEEGVVSISEARGAMDTELAVAETSGLRRARTYATAAVTRELRRVAPELVGTAGLRIHTTIDPAVQASGEEALRAQAQAIEAGERGPFLGTPLVDGVGPDEPVLQVAGVAIDPATGAIRGVIGGRDFEHSELDRALQARRPIGSLVKPFLLAGALERGMGLHHMLSTDPVFVETPLGAWSPEDHVEVRELPMVDMVALSSNRAAVRLGLQIGNERLVEIAGRLGLDAHVPAYPSAFLGAFDASPADVLSAYAPFANGGMAVEPYLIDRVESRAGEVLWERPGLPPEQVLSRETAFLSMQAMRQVVTRGTAWEVARAYPGPAAGKTGTSDDGHDAWFVGFTPRLAAVVWMGFDLPGRMLAGASGGGLAAPAWAEWMRAAELAAEDLDQPEELEDWSAPPGIRFATVDLRSGTVVPERCPQLDGTLRTWVTQSVPSVESCLGGGRSGEFRRVGGARGLRLLEREVPAPETLSLDR